MDGLGIARHCKQEATSRRRGSVSGKPTLESKPAQAMGKTIRVNSWLGKSSLS